MQSELTEDVLGQNIAAIANDNEHCHPSPLATPAEPGCPNPHKITDEVQARRKEKKGRDAATTFQELD